MSIPIITLTGTLKRANGTACAGFIDFIPNIEIQDSVGNIVVPTVPVTATLDSNGHFSIGLYATNDPSSSQTGVVYKVIERVNESPDNNYNIIINYNAPGGTVDLADIAPPISGTPQYIYASAVELAAHEQDPNAHSGTLTPGGLGTNNLWTGTNTWTGPENHSGTVTYTSNVNFGGSQTNTGDVYFRSGSPWTDVKAWGAVGDGVADDSVAIRQALATTKNVFLPPGIYNINTADINGNGLTLTNPGQWFFGSGEGKTTINIKVTGLKWGLVATAAQCRFKDFTVNVTAPIVAPYWVIGGTCGANGHNEFGIIENVFVNYGGAAVTVPVIPAGTSLNKPGMFALGPDDPTADKDIADWQLTRCWALANNSEAVAGYVQGNNATENITSNFYTNCVVTGAKWGLSSMVGSVRWYGGGFSYITDTDILVVGPTSSHPMSFIGMGGESGNQRLSCTSAHFTGQTEIEFDQCWTLNYTPTAVAGQIDTFNVTGTLRYSGGAITTVAGNNVTIGMNTAHAAIRPLLIVDGLTANNATPFPAASQYVMRQIRSTTFWDPATGIAAPNYQYQHVADTPQHSVQGRRTAGDITFNSAALVDIDNTMDIGLNAHPGDVLAVEVIGAMGTEAVEVRLLVATIVAGVPVNYIGGASNVYIPSWVGINGSTTHIAGRVFYTVQAGDMNPGGNVTLRLRGIGSAAVNKTIGATTAFPLIMNAQNLGASG